MARKSIQSFLKILHHKCPGEELVIFKADAKSAYRCVPIRPSHKEFANVILWHPLLRQLVMATQRAMPLGSVAAVYAWDRLAEALVYVIMSILLIPVIRYVDDLFGVCFKRDAQAVRAYVIKLFAMCGFAVELEKTPMPAPSQTILGISLDLVRTARRGVQHLRLHARLDRGKAEYWKALVDGILARGRITRKEAEQLAGRLNFLCYAVAGLAGLALLSNVYKATAQVDYRVSDELAEEVRWWSKCLVDCAPRIYHISNVNRNIVTLFTDAEGGGGGIGGILFFN